MPFLILFAIFVSINLKKVLNVILLCTLQNYKKKAEEILQSLGNKLSAINSPEPLLRPVPPYISDVITAMELLENKKYVLNIGKRTFNCGISGETQLRTAAEKGDIYSKIVVGVNLRKKNYKNRT